MATPKVKSMSKADWQKIAKKYEIVFTPKNTVRYLVEKVAELNGVDDKIVDLDELKGKVFDAITPKATKTVVKKSKPVTKVKQVSETKSVDPEVYAEEEKQHYQGECAKLGVQYGVHQNANDMKQILDYHCKQNPNASYITFGGDVKKVEEVEENQTLESLKLECDSLGLAYGSAHTVEDLTNLLSAFRVAVGSAGLQPIDEAMLNQGNSQAPELITNPSTDVKPNPKTVDMKALDIYSSSFLSTIANHFRLLSISEIHEMLNGGDYPFTYEVITNPASNTQVAITLTSGNLSKRVPNQNWINING